MAMHRTEIAKLICDRLETETRALTLAYEANEPRIGHFVVDDLLPPDLARVISGAFPKTRLKLNASLRERKEISAQMDQHDPLIEEALFAFQDMRVLELVGQIVGNSSVLPDPNLYAGGISAMRQGHFLNPHLDNSHDKDRQNWRVFNLLYYVTPDWEVGDGGNLELWPEGVGGERNTIVSQFNRLVVMATHDRSWHSVSPVRSDKVRRCISNYYFAPHSLRETESFHVTTFRGRPEQKIVDAVLRVDGIARNLVRKVKPNGVIDKGHRYQR